MEHRAEALVAASDRTPNIRVHGPALDRFMGRTKRPMQSLHRMSRDPVRSIQKRVDGPGLTRPISRKYYKPCPGPTRPDVWQI